MIRSYTHPPYYINYILYECIMNLSHFKEKQFEYIIIIIIEKKKQNKFNLLLLNKWYSEASLALHLSPIESTYFR